MTEEQLQAIRERAAVMQRDHNFPSPSRGWMALQASGDLQTLLAYVDFLQKLIHDLQSESTAYQRGLELGIAAERERCVRLCSEVENDFKQETTNFNLLFFGIADGARRCWEFIRNEERGTTP